MAEQDRYSLEKRLGAGAMGEVWQATDELLNRTVAIKYLKATDDARVKELFLSEARTLASLSHPNITLIYDAVFDEEQNRFYLVMEYVEGEPLSHIIDGWDGPLPTEIVLDMVIGVVEALKYAHEQGIVHRDIKPGNVMIEKGGVIKLTDFGIAGLISLLSEGSDFIIGTPAYISPEQIDGGGLDGRSDLYSLGIMLYEMVSGQGRPFHYTTQTKLFMAHLQEAPPNIKEVRPDLPLAVERIIMRLLAKEPDDRYASTDDLLSTLQSLRARQQFSQPHLQFLDPEAKPFVNRIADLEQIEDVWDEVQDTAQPRLLVVQGGMGLGKTRLITEFIAQDVVDQGLVALAGRCDEAGVPYAPFAEILGTIFERSLLPTTLPKEKLDELLRQIPGLSRILNIDDVPPPPDEDLTQLSPKKNDISSSSSGLWQTLTERMPTAAQTTDDFSQSQWQFSTTVLEVLSDLGSVALFLEDASYLDEASAKLIRFLIRQGQLPLLLIAACRDDEPVWLNDFGADEKIILTLTPLQSKAIHTYLENLLDGSVADEVTALIAERSQGRPLQIEEISRQLLEAKELRQDEQGVWHHTPQARLADGFLPESVMGAFTRRIEQLSDGSREALALAALLEPGPEFDVRLWTTVLENEQVAQAASEILKEAEKKRLIRPLDEHRYAFRPPDVAKALTATLTGTRRSDLHQQMASILHKADADPLIVAYHHEQAGSPQKASQYLQVAGAKAVTSQAADVALTYYHRAATMLESRSSYKAIGDLQRQQGNHAEAIDAYQRTVLLAHEAGDVGTEAQALNGLSLTFCLMDQYQEAQRRAEQVLKLDSVSTTERAVAQSHLGLSLWFSGHLAEAEAWCQQAIKVLEQNQQQTDLAEACYRLGLVFTSQGKLNQARIAFQQALKLRRTSKDKSGEARCLNSLGFLVTERGDFKQATTLFDTAENIFKSDSSQDGLVEVYTQKGRVWLYQQQPAKALVSLTEALTLANKIGEHQAHVLGTLYRLMAQAHLARGKVDIAKSVADDAFRIADGVGNREQAAAGQVTLAQIYAGRNDWPAAQIMYKEAMTLLETVGSRLRLVRAKLHYAQFLAQQDPTQAATLEKEARHEAKQLEIFLP